MLSIPQQLPPISTCFRAEVMRDYILVEIEAVAFIPNPSVEAQISSGIRQCMEFTAVYSSMSGPVDGTKRICQPIHRFPLSGVKRTSRRKAATSPYYS